MYNMYVCDFASRIQKSKTNGLFLFFFFSKKHLVLLSFQFSVYSLDFERQEPMHWNRGLVVMNLVSLSEDHGFEPQPSP